MVSVCYRAVGHDGLIEIEPRSELALIECAASPLRRTVTVEVPTTVCVLSRYATDPGTVSVSFMNRGKVPMSQLELYCTPLQGPKGKRSDCHTEAGLFFPGTSYTMSFAYPGKSPRAMSLSLKTALLRDGVRWTSIHDQPCKSLKITNR